VEEGRRESSVEAMERGRGAREGVEKSGTTRKMVSTYLVEGKSAIRGLW